MNDLKWLLYQAGVTDPEKRAALHNELRAMVMVTFGAGVGIGGAFALLVCLVIHYGR